MSTRSAPWGHALIALLTLTPAVVSAQAVRPTAADVAIATRYHTTRIGGVDLFYREAGPADGPVIVLLHGFPSSSHMFRNLIPQLADRYRVIAPDYPGFGHSGTPPRERFRYSFETFADHVDSLLSSIGANRYALYVMDYGAPVGYRLALKHPERVTALIVQNGNAYAEGLREFWTPIKALRQGTTLQATRWQYLDGVRDSSRVDPSAWLHDQALLDRPGNIEIQLDLFRDYGNNVALYPRFQSFFRERRPPTLIVWGRNDQIFPAEGAHPYLRDLPDAEFHLLDTGHFALEDKGDEIALLMRDFLARRLPARLASGR